MTARSAALVLVAAAVLLGGHRVGAGRLRGTAATGDPPLIVLRPTWIAVGAAAVGALTWTVAGAGAGLAAALLGVAVGLVARRLVTRPAGGHDDVRGLASAWELVAVGLRSGLPVAAAVGAAAEPLSGPIGIELRRVAGLLELGADPVDAWSAADRTPPIAAFARAAVRSAGTGAALAQVAVAESVRLRGELVDSAQARAQRAGVLITGPLGLCFLPAFLVLGIAPVVIGLAGQALARW